MKESGTDDVLTILAIAVVAYAIADVVHEGLGHGGACLLTGGWPLVLSTVHFECSDDNRLVMAGGTIANFVAGVVAWGLGRATKGSPPLRYFLWLSMTVNLLQGAGYFLFSGVAGIGDWADFVKGLEPAWAWRTALVILGSGLYIECVRRSLVELLPLVGNRLPERWQRGRRLAVVAYIAGGVLFCLAGLLNPVGMILIAISAAAASFGGTSGLAWMWMVLKNPDFPKSQLQFGPITRRPAWIAAAVIVGVLFVAVLGPSIRLQ